MKRVYVSSSLADAGHARNLLEQEGIRCMIKNETLVGGLGEIPFLDCQPEVWVLDDANEERARRVLHAALHAGTPPDTRGEWRCAECGETNEPQFAACFNCGRPDTRPQ